MPTYIYKDLETGEIYEFKQSMKDGAYTHHPETGAAIKRVPVAPAIAFKGSGFYATDSRQAAGKPAAGGQADKPASKSGQGSASAPSSPSSSAAGSSTASGGGGQ